MTGSTDIEPPPRASASFGQALPPANILHAPAALCGGILGLLRQTLSRRAPLDAAAFKRAMIPFVHHLPRMVRAPLRRLWRGWRIPAGDVAGSDESSTEMPVETPIETLLEARQESGAPVCAESGAQASVAPDSGAASPPSPPDAYGARVARELEHYNDQLDVHSLPAIFHYWSNRHLLPIEQQFGVRDPEHFLATHLLAAARETGAARLRFVSLGSGNCDAEVRIARSLLDAGLTDFTLECVDINPAMLERGRALAVEAGLESHVLPVQGDFNHWQPAGIFDAVMANQSLHHVTELEALFGAIAGALAPQGKFVVSDMIGRNGHQRWPEALQIVREFWQELPDAYRYNVQLRREEPGFIDWDCAVEGFEGVRAQDILPLLLDRFGFEVFIAFGNVIDPFIDRGFGHHFDPQRPWDRDFIDRVHRRDEAELLAGNIKPTHMLAVLRTARDIACLHRPGLSPRQAVRRADAELATQE